MDKFCDICEEIIPSGRINLGYTSCCECSTRTQRKVRRTVVPMHKSNYMLVTDYTLLKELTRPGR